MIFSAKCGMFFKYVMAGKRSEIKVAKTETVVYTEHAERITFGVSYLWKVYRKTIPELSWGEIRNMTALLALQAV